MIVDALSRKYALLLISEAKFLVLYFMMAFYIEDEGFKTVVEDPSTFGSFALKDGFLFKGNKICIPENPLTDLIVKESHGGAFVNYFGINKACEIPRPYLFRW